LTIEFLTLYAFSAENWQRPKAEVFALMHLLDASSEEKTQELLEKNVRLQAIGRLTDLPVPCQKRLHKSIEQTAGNNGLTLILALSYGGRLEIIDGIKSLMRQVEAGHIDSAMIDVEMFSKHLYTRYYPDPDLLIRTVRRAPLCRTSCSGNSPTPRCMSRRSSGRISPSRTSSRPWRNTASGSDATVRSCRTSG
jgi:undecaprenyl diphosphate synthase